MKTAKQIRAGLRKFNATTQTHRHKSGFQYTSKVKYLADSAECHWLIDLIGDYQPMTRRYLVQHWQFRLQENEGILSFYDGNRNRLFWKVLPLANFPLSEGVDLRVSSDILYIPRQKKPQVGKLLFYSWGKQAA
ncbi:MAG: hypothetical protein HC852_01750 [Acaryochloridaceae cyanobacterium RU_4_10]|nr:hypothetical protein [Acaryochloridaceae cyanobacterium RU_4_10]